MKRFVEGLDRSQATFLPECLDDFIGEDNAVRVVDVFVERLDLRELGFSRVEPKSTGRSSYHPSVLLKLYIYGYLNRVQSSRRLEREAGRNIEVMWLLGRLVPDHKTIADFRKDNGKAICKVCSQFVELCRRVGLLTSASVAIDGSKFKAVNNRDRNYTKAKMARRLKALEVEMKASPDVQVSLTDPDARSMATSGRGSGVVGYNVQAAVDTEHHLIVAHDVIQSGSDRAQLAPMAEKAKIALGVDEINVVADRDYFSAEQILECDRANITPTLPKPMTSGNRKRGLFVKQDFRYDVDDDVYICPAGECLKHHSTSLENGLTLRRYWHNGCHNCAIKGRCTTGKERRVTRWEHEHLLEAVQHRLDQNPDAMRTRRETVEHPFGTIKARMGATYFLMKQLKNVKTETALNVLAYNLTRVMNILGPGPLIQAMRA